MTEDCSRWFSRLIRDKAFARFYVRRKYEISVFSIILACILAGLWCSCEYFFGTVYSVLYRWVDVNAENREMSNDSFVVDGRYNRGCFVKVTWLCPRRIESFLFFFLFFWKCFGRIRETDANSRLALLPEFFVSNTKGNRIKYSIHLVPPVRNQEGKVRIIAEDRFSVELIVFVWCLGQSIRSLASQEIFDFSLQILAMRLSCLPIDVIYTVKK